MVKSDGRGVVVGSSNISRRGPGKGYGIYNFMLLTYLYFSHPQKCVRNNIMTVKKVVIPFVYFIL